MKNKITSNQQGFAIFLVFIVVLMLAIAGLVIAIIIPRTEIASKLIQNRTLSNWKTYSYLDKKFKVDFPSSPKLDTQTEKINDQVTLIQYMYTSDPDIYNAFIASLVLLPSDIVGKVSSTDKEKVLENMANNFFKNMQKVKVNSTQKSTFKGFPALIVEAQETTEHVAMKAVVFITDDRIAMLLVGTSGDKVNETYYQKFVNSYYSL